MVVKLAVLVVASRLTVPVSAGSPAPMTVKLVVSMVVAFIASLKVATTLLLSATDVAVSAGPVSVTVGTVPPPLLLLLLHPDIRVASRSAASHKIRPVYLFFVFIAFLTMVLFISRITTAAIAWCLLGTFHFDQT